MNYIEWNNLISKYFFNPENAGKDIHLYITKADIVNIAKEYISENNDDEIWNDFILAIKGGLIGSYGNITAKAKNCYERRHLNKLDSFEIKYPPYITYLALF